MLKKRKGQFFPYSDSAPRKSLPVFTVLLILANVAVFFWSYFLNFDAFDSIVYALGFTPANPTVLTLFTSMFLHGGIDHIFGNMWYLWIFGDNVEDKFGRFKFILFYFMSGLAATFTQYLTEPASAIPSIGASGAISGVLGAYMVFYPKEKVLSSIGYSFVRIPAFVVIGFWFFIQFIFGTVSLLGGVGSGIAFWAHIGGFVFGFVVALFARGFSRDSG